MKISKEDVLHTALDIISEECCAYFNLTNDKPTYDIGKNAAETIGCIGGVCSFTYRMLKKGDNDDEG